MPNTKKPAEQKKDFLRKTNAAEDTPKAAASRGIDRPANPLKTSVTTHGADGEKKDLPKDK